MSAPLRDLRAERAVDAGMWLFLASLVMFFGGLYSGYVLLRTGSDAWTAPWLVTDGVASTLVQAIWLLGCAAAAWRWRVGRASASGRALPMFTWMPLLAAAIFALRWLAAATALAGAGHPPAASVAAASWYVLTGFVATGTLAGGVAVAWLAWRHRVTGPPEHVARQVQRYWTLLAACWIAIVAGMYLW
ncbi:MAG: hypothetical protein R2708_06795 [Vicinamibacterales bacterium]